jgi:uncharacterized protein YgiM (DUF1202 family)
MTRHECLNRRQFMIGLAAVLVSGTGIHSTSPRTLAAIGRYIVTSGPLRLRAWAGLSAPVVGTLPEGAILDVLEWDGAVDGHEWAYVDVVGAALSGHVATTFIAPYGNPEPFAVGSIVHVERPGGGRVNMRSGPGLAHSVIAVLSDGTTGQVKSGATSADGYDWIQVLMENQIGWVATSLLAGGEGPDANPSAGFPSGTTVYVAVDRLNVRSGPSTGHGIVATLTYGTAVTVAGPSNRNEGRAWYPVTLPSGSIGWVAGDFLTASAIAPEPSGGAFAAGDRVAVDVDAVNFRSAAGTAAGVIMVLYRGHCLTVIGGPVSANGYTWYQARTLVHTDSVSGWVIQGALRLRDDEEPDPGLLWSPGGVAHVAVDRLNLRAEPTLSAAVVTVMPRDATLTITGTPVGAGGYTWYPGTTASGASGWAAAEFLR